jgi:ATP-dependent helicase/nuclease subunit A
MMPMSDVPVDRAVRLRALDPGRSFIVQAPAGSGKTTLLTQRFLRLLSVVEQPESIVAITFTRKAAEEMRGRVLNALQLVRVNPEALDPETARWAGAALSASERHGWRLLENPRRLRMQTIDSLSATLAKRGPLMSGYAGNPEVLEDASHLYRTAAHAAIAELDQSGPWSDAIQILLRHLDNDWERLEGLLGDMLGRRDQWLRFIVQQPDRDVFEHALQLAINSELQLLYATLPQRLHENLIQIGAFVAENLLGDYPDAIGVVLAGCTTMPGPNHSDLAHWQGLATLFLKRDGGLRVRLTKKDGFPPQGARVAEYKALFAELTGELAQIPSFVAALNRVQAMPQPSYSEHQWQSIEALFLVLKLAAAELKIVFDRGASIDFVEVSHAALAALGPAQDPSDLGLILDYQIQHLLIDEFQDTSITQFELIERLLDGWVDGDGRTLFLVGDPMQSIYRFRQADVNLFIDTCSATRLAAVPLEVLQLTTNFRSQAGVIDWINETLVQMRTDPQCPFVQMPELVAARPPAAAAAIHRYGFVAAGDAVEAAAVVDIVRRTQADSPEQSIGILVRGRRHLGSISEALLAADISVRASDIDRLGDQSIVQDLVALTRALLHPADRTAWFGILRAPWCGISLKSLAVLFEGSTDMTIWQRLSDGFETDDILPVERDLLNSLCNTIATARRAVGREPFAPLLEGTWAALGGPNAYGDRSLVHAERYFELLVKFDRSDTLVTAKRLDDLLERQYVAPAPTAESTVEIMTIHRAKGLEFDVVILPGIGRVPPSDRHRLLAWKQHLNPGGPSLLFAPIPRVGSRGDNIHAYLHGAEKQALEDEGYRLLYVALTRARETLHLIGTVGEGKDGVPALPPPKSFLKMLFSSSDAQWNFATDAHANAPIEVRNAAVRHQQIRRPQLVDGLHRNVQLPHELSAARTEVEFAWASPLAKHIGTVTHSLLQRICVGGLSLWNVDNVRNAAPYIEARLRGLGVGQGDLVEARERIIAAVKGALASVRGRWIMDDRHIDAESEYALSSVVEQNLTNIIIDRTFVDANGVRWIIDFKIGAHTGGSKDAFIASEVERYRPQLDGYAQLMQFQENKPIALGLFFPLLDEWREWHYSSENETRAMLQTDPNLSL